MMSKGRTGTQRRKVHSQFQGLFSRALQHCAWCSDIGVLRADGDVVVVFK